MKKVELGEEERIRASEARTTTWLRIAVVQQVLLVGLLASSHLTLDAKIAASHAQDDTKMQTLEQGTRLHAHEVRLEAASGRTLSLDVSAWLGEDRHVYSTGRCLLVLRRWHTS